MANWHDENNNPAHHINQVLASAGHLLQTWQSAPQPVFAPSPSPIWTDTGRRLAAAGLPWHNNQINLPDETDSAWPFHFKALEARVLRRLGARVGMPEPSGYVSDPAEANCYCVRALQRELRVTFPGRRPVLLHDRFDAELVRMFGEFFGLETHRVDLSSSWPDNGARQEEEEGEEDVETRVMRVTAQGTRPIIFAVSTATAEAECDDLAAVARLSEKFAVLLHVDASRNFDYLTAMPAGRRHQYGLETLALGTKRRPEEPLRSPLDGSITAGTIVAGSLHHRSRHGPVAALKPPSLGGGRGTRVAYIRSYDSTLGGSRDAIAPLWLSVAEARLGDRGAGEVCRHLEELQTALLTALEAVGVPAYAPPYCPDVVVQSCTEAQRQRLLDLGGVPTDRGTVVLCVQPQLTVESLASAMAPWHPLAASPPPLLLPKHKDFARLYPVREDDMDHLRATVRSWKVCTRSTAGSPVHMGSLSALGPVVGRFFPVGIPRPWVDGVERSLLEARAVSFGLGTPERRREFKGGFTTGSTMGNRCGIHAALAQFPGAFVYVSAAAHYSVMKILQDCDAVTGRWSDGSSSGSGLGPRYAQIPIAEDGSMLIDALVRQALLDKQRCADHAGEEESYRVILFANIGSTFVGARDDIAGAASALAAAGIGISYIHADGAFDFGYDTCGVGLGPPGARDAATGGPLVQGITVSRHKALGQSVSGEVLCYSPGREITGLSAGADPRTALESWLYGQVYRPEDVALLLRCGRGNAAHLASSLGRLGYDTRLNPGSIIVVFERPPAWIVEEFGLRPEGDWVHFITLPYLSRPVIDLFVDRVASVDRACAVAFSAVDPLLSGLAGRRVTLKRLQCRGALTERVRRLLQQSSTSSSSSSSPSPSEPDRAVDAETSVIASCIRGSLSVVALDDKDDILAVFLAHSHRDQSMRAGAMYIDDTLDPLREAVVDVAEQLMGTMATYLRARLRTDDASYSVHTFQQG